MNLVLSFVTAATIGLLSLFSIHKSETKEFEIRATAQEPISSPVLLPETFFEKEKNESKDSEPVAIIESVPETKETPIEPTPVTTTPPPAEALPVKEEIVITPEPDPTSVPVNKKMIGYQEKLLGQINTYRSENGLGSVSMIDEVCNFASLRAQEINESFSHDKFIERINNNSFPYPSYSEVTENIAMADNEDIIVGLWRESPTHAENMRKNTPYVCVSRVGNYYAYEGWTP